MDAERFDQLVRFGSSQGSRRTLVSALAVGLLTAFSGATDHTRAKKRKKKKKPAVPSSPLVPLAPPASPPPPTVPPIIPPSPPPPPPIKVLAPFTVEAAWTTTSDHDTYLFVPARVDIEHPYIDYFCNSNDTENGAKDPFAFVSEDAGGGGGPHAEITTVRALLSGTYEYWIEVEAKVPAADLTVTLRNFGGHVVRSWTSPANDSIDQLGWHVFDIAGPSGILTSVDQLRTEGLPELYDEIGYVCPD